MSYENTFRGLMARIEAMDGQLKNLTVRINNMFREGVVESVDFEKGVAVVNAQGVKTKPSPWLAQAGSINEWTPPEVGQRVFYVSPGGDLGRGFILPGGFTDDVPQPHNEGGQKRVKIGECVVTQSESGLVLEVGGTKFSFTSDGYQQDGGSVAHDDKDIGKTHRHRDTMPGSGLSGIPVPKS